MENGSSVFYLSTFEVSYTVQMIICGICLPLYVVTVLANLLVFVAVLMCAELQKPMFMLLGNMAVADIIGCTCSVPKQLQILLTGDSSILHHSCFVQMFSVHLFGKLEVMTLSAMALDRYVAICHPLRYHTIVTNKKTLGVLLLMWAVGTALCMALTLIAAGLKFSDTKRKIQGIFCDNMGLVSMSESDISAKIVNVYGTVLVVGTFLLPLVFISYSYVNIFLQCRINRSPEITKHGLHTLLTHFLALSIFFFSIFSTVLIPRFVNDINSPTVRNIRCSFQFGILVVPISNVMIYFFRTKELRKGVTSCKNIFLQRTLFPRVFKVRPSVNPQSLKVNVIRKTGFVRN